MHYFYGALLFILGSVIGSFLNVCAYRIPRRESVVSPPSHCPSCGGSIRSFDNIPIVSYLLLRGRCRSCKAQISPKYLVVELATGTLWSVAYLHYGLTAQLAFALFFVTVLVLLSAIDYDTKTIPNRILLPAMAASVLLLPLYLMRLETIPVVAGSGVTPAVLGFVAGGGFLYLIAVLAPLIFKKEAMGGGDIKLAAFMGLYLGGYVMLALFIGFFLGAITGVILMSKDKSMAREMIPFGPFLAVGAVVTIFFGPQLWNGYLSISGLA